MSASTSINTLTVFLILVSAAKPLVAAIPENPHADPSLIVQERYGPIRRNDTLWSIAKLLLQKGENINAVIAELEQANPKAIRPGRVLFVGEYIQRHSQFPTIAPLPQLEMKPQLVKPKQISEFPVPSEQRLLSTMPDTQAMPKQETDNPEWQPSSALFYLSLLSVLGGGLLAGLRRFKQHRQQQQIEQDALDKINTIKRESIKNRLKTSFE